MSDADLVLIARAIDLAMIAGFVGWMMWVAFDCWRWSRLHNRHRQAVEDAKALITSDPLGAARQLQKLHVHDPAMCALYGTIVESLENQTDIVLH